ncbi:MAG: EAL domain-containing protein [Bdellovibrio sp.]|nr:EAL domain-containing protein [Methylotenera sp.]
MHRQFFLDVDNKRLAIKNCFAKRLATVQKKFTRTNDNRTKNPVVAIQQAVSHTTHLHEPVIVDEHIYKEKIRAETALNSISDAVICTDINGNVDYLNIAAENITGWRREDAFGRASNEIFNIINSNTRLPVINPIDCVLQTQKARGLPPNTLLIKRDGTEVEIEDSISPIHNWEGQYSGVVIVFHDVSATKAMASKMAHLAQHDCLTNLPNRMLLNDRIAQAITLANRHHKQLGVLYLDLDNFKHINDSLGHLVGDKLLQSVAKCLKECVRDSDTVSRQGGDEFVILLAETKNSEDAALTAQKILDALHAVHHIGKTELHVTTSIGVSVYPADGLDAETLLKNADTAMYYAKEKGRNNYQFFIAEMNTRAIERLIIESNLKLALEKQQFILYYQPKVNLSTGLMTGAEALLRWQHDEWGEVVPDIFVPVAEDSGLIVPIGRWVLRQACLQAKLWQDAGLQDIAIAINISAQEFLQKDFVAGVRTILKDTGLDAQFLELEITESVLMRDAECSRTILMQLKKMGIKLAVDDFGTGYSSLSYLQRFPIDVLKIDQSFVQNIESAKDDGIIVSAIISMGNSLKLKVVAEGVETASQLAFLKARHCEEGQGYFFSHPLTAEQFAKMLLTNMPALDLVN